MTEPAVTGHIDNMFTKPFLEVSDYENRRVSTVSTHLSRDRQNPAHRATGLLTHCGQLATTGTTRAVETSVPHELLFNSRDG